MGRSGGLALLWKNDSLVEIQNYNRRHINAIVRNAENAPCRNFTWFYGNLEAGKRHESWSLLRHIFSLVPIPWVCMGDFNEITMASEKFGTIRWQMDNFNSTLEDCHLLDLGFIGPKFTWCSKREGADFVKERLDKVVANHEWCRMNSVFQVEVLAARSSDHAPLLFSFGSTQ